MIGRRTLLGAGFAAGLAPKFARGQGAYPSRPIRLVVPFAAGGGTDLVMRAVGDAVAEDWKANILIENKPGAGTTLGASDVAHAPADGYSLLANTASFLISPRLMVKRPYEASDFVPVALVASSPHVLVVAKDVPASTLPDFVNWAKARGRPATYASFGVGSSSHLGYEILRERLGLELVHVPYRGAAPALIDLLGGRVDTMLADLSTVTEQVKSGSVKALAVAGKTRSPALPDIPTIAQAGVADFTSESWFGLMMRAGTDAAIVQRWARAVQSALQTQSVKSKLGAIGIEPIGEGPEGFAAVLKADDEKYAAAIARSGAKME